MYCAKKSPKAAIIIVLVLLALIAIGVFIYLRFFTYRSVKVEEYDGEVKLERKGNEKNIFEGLKLIPEDKVTTGENGILELFIDTDKHVVARENTCFTVNAVGSENSGKVTIDLKYGSTLIMIDEKLAEGSEFEVETSNAICSVRGTIFEVEYDTQSHTSEIAVTEGVVKLKTENEELELTAGQKAVVTDDEIKTYLLFGTYEQDGNLSNGPEPIEWEVLDTDENGTMLISRYILDEQRYNETQEDVTWENCTLRHWLNSDFYNAAFTQDEQAQICSVTIPNPDNAWRGTPGGNETADEVFLLSVDEVKKYYSFEEWDDEEMRGRSSALIVPPTEYAKDFISWNILSHEEYDSWAADAGYPEEVIGKEGACWWLRSPGYAGDVACKVFYYGSAGWYSESFDVTADCGVRPAIYIDPEYAKLPSAEKTMQEDPLIPTFGKEPAAEPEDSGGDVWDENRTWTDRDDILPHQEGDYIVFGAYEQDGDLTNGPEPIEWEVLDSDGNGTLLISRYVLDAKPYNTEQVDVTWEICTLRRWLNHDFMNNAFTTVEQDCIRSVMLSNPDNARWDTPGGNATTDRVFILGVDEIRNHYPFEEWEDVGMWGSSSALITLPTEYAKLQGVGYSNTDEMGAWWWLRSPGFDSGSACSAYDNGHVGWGYNYGSVSEDSGGVRPALYITQ